MAGLAVGIGQDAFMDIRSLFQTSIEGQYKRDATTVVNGLAPLFQENLDTFKANPTPTTQAQAIATFNYMWITMVGKLESFGKGGTAGVNDRAPGGKFDWWKAYLDPIRNYKGLAGADAVGGKMTPNIDTDSFPKTPETKGVKANTPGPGNTAGVTPAALIAKAKGINQQTADVWNFYYSGISGVHQTANLFTPGNRSELITAETYLARRGGATTGTSPSNVAGTASAGVTQPATSSPAGGTTQPPQPPSRGYGAFAALIVVGVVGIWLATR